MWEIYERRRVSRSLNAAPGEVLKRYEKWKGYRSSRLNIQYRVLYKIAGDKVLVQVEDITAQDYRRK